MSIGAELLARPAGHGARLLALSFLEEATRARKRLDHPHDDQALHDLRVALRRLRSCLRAYRPQLEASVRKKDRRRLRRLVRATGAPRDLEVQGKWLTDQHQSLDDRERVGLDWLLERLHHDAEPEAARLERSLKQEWPKLRRSLKRDVPRYTVLVRLDRESEEEQGAVLLARLARSLATELHTQLETVGSATDVEQAHEARISAKRLRYLLAPIEEQVDGAAILLDRLESLQDVLGDLHDAHVLESDLSKALADATRELEPLPTLDEHPATLDHAQSALARSYDVRLGLLALAQRVHDRRDTTFARYRDQWSPFSSAVFFRQVEQFADRLASGDVAPAPDD